MLLPETMLSQTFLVVLVPGVLLTGVLVTAIASDLRSRKIPNQLVLGGLVLALLWHAAGPAGRSSFDPVMPGATGALGAVAAFLVMLAAFFPFYALRIMGAGDVKLIAVAGAFLGMSGDAWGHLPGLGLSILVAGGVLALARMAISRNAASVLRSVRLILVLQTARIAGLPVGAHDARTGTIDRMPYAIAIGAGTLFYSVGTWSGWLKFL